MAATDYWPEAIKEAETRGGFTALDVHKAGSWVTCACGKQDPRLLMDGQPSCGPWDYKLRDLGVQFFNAVLANSVSQARELLASIEERASDLLASPLPARRTLSTEEEEHG